MGQMRLNLGIIADGLNDQLGPQGLRLGDSDLEFYERVREAINLLAIRGYIMPSAADRAFKKLIKEISKSAKEESQQ